MSLDTPSPFERPPEQTWLDALDPMQSLRVRAAVLFGIMPVLFTIAFANIVVRSMRNQIADQTGPNLTILATQVADKLDRAIWERYNEIQLAATFQPMRFGTTEERRRILSTLATSSPNYVWLTFVDSKTGINTAASRGLEEGLNVDERNWYRMAKAETAASDIHGPDGVGPEPALGNGARFIDIATPVMGGGNAAVGVIAARLDWSVAKEVQSSVVPDTTRRARLNVSIYAPGGEVLLDSGGSGWDNALDLPTLPDKERVRGSLWEEAPNGEQFLTGYSRTSGYRDFRKLFLLVTVRQKGTELLAPAEELKDRILAIGFGLSALSAVGGWFVGWRLSRRIILITRAAGRIEAGDVLTVIPSYKGNDEIARLAAAVGAMTEELRARGAEPEPPQPQRNTPRQ